MIRKIAILALVLTVVAGSNVFASSARWQALGNDNRFIIDTSNYGPYPARVNQFSNALFIIPVPPDFGANNLACGALFTFKENMTAAFHFNLPSAGAKKLSATLKNFTGINDRLANLDVRPWPDLFWGMKTGSTMVGARLALAMDSASNDKKTSASAVDLNLGATLFGTPYGDLDVGLNVAKQGFSDEEANVESTGGMGVLINARLNKPLDKTYTLVPVLSAKFGSNPTVKDENEVSYMGGDIGAGVRMKTAKKQLILAGLTAGYNAVTTTPKTGDKTTDTTLKAKVLTGAEMPLTKWLTVRGGMSAEKILNSNGVKNQDVQFYYNMGLRVKYNGLIIDAILSRDIFHRGPYLISGADGDLATNVCVVYKF